MLALALTDPAQLDGFLAFTDLFIVKCAEFGLVFASFAHVWWLAVDGTGILPWSPRQKTFAATRWRGFLSQPAFFCRRCNRCDRHLNVMIPIF